MPSDKDILFKKVQNLFQESQTIAEFEKRLSKADIKTYHRNEKLCGVYCKNRRYRLKRSLGIDPEHLLLKDKTLERINSLGEIIDEREQDLSKGYDLEL
ncbi:MAG: hypothetical protein GKR88_19420 [Flavobacteriaceae bacterium]|nr:MAG: hypothetical protein GKR88_19420 [Flavobacteriaceae bacterium]